jgi:hypothetical protein
MTNSMIARINMLLATKESLPDRVMRFAKDFGLNITKDDIIRSMGVDTRKVPDVPDQPVDMPSNSEFMSILIYLYVMSFKNSFKYSEGYLNYLDTVFHLKCIQGELRLAEILFYEIFSERL